ncbi:undecaprenyl-phosphate glucose phosphotransferase [candidate division KSB1 bacterium]|nr:undecaprenyl-phosphate glucose phosphotransferase [candidate division KSB1 bacterium]
MLQKREGELLLPFISLISDGILIECSFLLSYWFRFYSPLVQYFPVTKGFPPIAAYFQGSLVLIMVWLVLFQRFGLYGTRRLISFLDEFYDIIKVVTLGMLVMMSAAFFYRGFSFSRLVFLYIWMTSIVLLSINRIILIEFKHRRFERGYGLLNAAIIGSGKWTTIIFEKVSQHPEAGLRILGTIGSIPDLAQTTSNLGEKSDLPDIIRRHNIHVLLFVLHSGEREALWQIMKSCEGLNVEFVMLPDNVEMMTSRIEVLALGGIPLLRIKDVRIKGWEGVLKRVFDLVIASLGLIVISPLLLIVAGLIKLTSRGSVFYKQNRVGFDGKEFCLYKFRSMKIDAEKETGPIWAVENDPRVTPIGRILRRTSIDELPQLFNVLIGDMSIVGPRPERRVFVDKFKHSIPKYLERHRVKSGITGWAQINGLRGNTPIEERTRFDIYYVENWSLAFDFRIIMKTLWAVIVGENSY